LILPISKGFWDPLATVGLSQTVGVTSFLQQPDLSFHHHIPGVEIESGSRFASSDVDGILEQGGLDRIHPVGHGTIQN